MFSLLFAKGKINSFEQLKDNFDLEAVRLYYLGGSLIGWLEMCGKLGIAERVRNIDTNKDIDIQLAEIFGQPIPIKVDIERAQKFADVKKSVSAFILSDNPLKYAVSVNQCSFIQNHLQQDFTEEKKTDSFSPHDSSFFTLNGSFEYNSGSFKYGAGSFSHEYESEYEKNSFAFEHSSFSAMASSYTFSNTSFFLKTTSFSFKETSFFFNQGSFVTTSFQNKHILSSFPMSSFTSSFSSSSLTSCYDEVLNNYSNKNSEEMSKSPEEKIYENLSYCPLNRFGYGIHLI